MKRNFFASAAAVAGFFAAAALSIAAVTPVTPLPDDPACTAQDRVFMNRAVELAAAASAHGNASYGAVLVKGGKIIMEFETCGVTTGDVTQHAETGLISLASRTLGKDAFTDATLYTSTEPCIMCCGAISAAGLKKFVYGTSAWQVARLRGGMVPASPLECREVFARRSRQDVVILGPLREAEGLVVHAVHLARVAKP